MTDSQKQNLLCSIYTNEEFGKHVNDLSDVVLSCYLTDHGIEDSKENIVELREYAKDH